MLNQTLKAARDEISGILRSASAKPDLEVRIFDRNLSPAALREKISDWVPDGLITDNRGSVPAILPGPMPNYVVFKENGRTAIPVVYLDFTSPNASSVTIDNAAVGKSAATFFLRRKYGHFAFVGTNLGHTSAHAKARADAFARALAAEAFPCDRFEIDEQTPSKWSSELERLKSWLTALPRPCAVMAHADVYAQLVTDACRLGKLSIPEQIALVGVDNEIDIADNLRPTLSSILPDFEKAGQLALDALVKLMNGKRRIRRPIRFSYGVKALVERGSTQDTRGANRLVDSARGIIRNRALEGIRVTDIARELHVSPRLLEIHFNKVTRHSIQEELLSFRLDEVKRRLAETVEPIESIALQCGWRSSTALKILFRKRFRMTMRDFRKSKPL